MASTRNNNMPCEYNLQQNSYKNILNYNSYTNSSTGKPYNTSIPDLGYIPSHMSNTAFSNNPIDIESSLLGINSTNLVSPQEVVVPDLKTINTIKFFDTIPTYMPNPLVIEGKQRPFPVPN